MGADATERATRLASVMRLVDELEGSLQHQNLRVGRTAATQLISTTSEWIAESQQDPADSVELGAALQVLRNAAFAFRVNREEAITSGPASQSLRRLWPERIGVGRRYQPGSCSGAICSVLRIFLTWAAATGATSLHGHPSPNSEHETTNTTCSTLPATILGVLIPCC
jgi:hypothetical protein